MKEKAILKGDSTANETENCKDFSNKSSFECSYFYLGDDCIKEQSSKGKLANIYWRQIRGNSKNIVCFLNQKLTAY